MKGRTILDPYAILNRKMVKAAGLDYLTLGLSELSTFS